MTKSWFTALAILPLAFALSVSAQAQSFGADRHVAAGVKCEACHGPDKANPQEPTIETCTGCHNVKKLVEKTKDLKPTNPHFSPHYQDTLDCINCHVMHGETENFCNQCHQFDFKVP